MKVTCDLFNRIYVLISVFVVFSVEWSVLEHVEELPFSSKFVASGIVDRTRLSLVPSHVRWLYYLMVIFSMSVISSKSLFSPSVSVFYFGFGSILSDSYPSSFFPFLSS